MVITRSALIATIKTFLASPILKQQNHLITLIDYEHRRSEAKDVVNILTTYGALAPGTYEIIDDEVTPDKITDYEIPADEVTDDEVTDDEVIDIEITDDEVNDG